MTQKPNCVKEFIESVQDPGIERITFSSLFSIFQEPTKGASTAFVSLTACKGPN